MGFQNLEAGTRQLQGFPNPGNPPPPHEDEGQLLEKRHSGHISAARVALPPRPTSGFKEFRGDNVVCGATTQSLILRQKPKKRSCPLPLTLSYCNNACCATMQNKSGWGSHIWGGLGGAIAAQAAIRAIGGVSRYRGAIAAIVSPIAV